MKRVLAVSLGLATVLSLVVGCSSASPVQQAQGVTAMVASDRPSAVMQAEISGTLTLTDSGCFAVTSGGITYPLQFPFGSQLSKDGAEIMVPGLLPLRVGDEISGGGGYLHLSDVNAACVADNEHDEYAVWQTVND